MDTSEGIGHLQAAAREMVAAARSFLDALEDVVDDDTRMATMFSGMSDALKDATSMVSDLGRRPGPRSGGPSGSNGAVPRVERIDVE
jgi:hypothetical protein